MRNPSRQRKMMMATKLFLKSILSIILLNLVSVVEIFVGKMPGQNTPTTTTMASIDQALKVFTAIHKRMYRALSKEYSKLFKLNAMYIDKVVYFTLNSPQGNIPQKVYASD